MKKHTVLCVDDEPDNIDALERLLRAHYRVLKTTSPDEALVWLKDQPVTVIVSDQRMPGMTGVEFLSRSRELQPSAGRVLLTGYADIAVVIDSINKGEIYRYIQKPWEPNDLINAVRRAVERVELQNELEIKNKQLSIALEDLRSLDQAKTQFMLVVNHELRTPLTTIFSFLQLLEETALTTEQKKFLSRISAGATRLNELVADTLELVAAETGLLKTEKSRFQISEALIKELVTPTIRQLFESRKTHPNIRVEGKAQIHTDRKILSKVMERLLHNAAKFADPGSAIDIDVDTAAAGHTTLAISNLSAPMDEATLRRMLKPFALNENVLNHSQGLGLGLTLCQALLKRAGVEFQLSCEGRRFTAKLIFS